MRKIIRLAISFVLVIALTVPLALTALAAEESSVQYGTMEFYDSTAEEKVYTDSYRYTDAWFSEDAGTENPDLALASMQLVAASSDAKDDGLAVSFLNELGFSETGVGRYDADDPYDCVYVWGKKTIGEGADAVTLVAVAIQSYAFDDETKTVGWKQNFGINGDQIEDEQYSYDQAVDNIIGDVEKLGGDENVKYWITGQSRGGALAGMLSTRLSENPDTQVFAYTFEAPAQVGGDTAERASSDYPFIHNYICTDDVVTTVPPWGMVRYGVDHVLNTEEVDAKLSENLEKLGATHLVVPSSDEVSEFIEKTHERIKEVVPTREDYSKDQEDSFTDSEGNQVSVTYNWQNVFQNLMGVLFGGGISGINTDAIMENAGALAPAIESLASAIKNNSNADYYDAAQHVKSFLEQSEIDLSLTDSDLYALLKLAGPLIINSEYEPQSNPLSTDDMMNYVEPLFMLYVSRNNLTFSHQYPSIIARLHALAGDQMMDDLALEIDDPAAGDEQGKTPKDLEDAVNGLGNSWLSVSSAWETEDSPLENGKVYYLDVTVEAIGHTVPEDFQFTINVNEPVEPLTVSHETGAAIIKARFAFTIGDTKPVTVTFDTQGHITAPEAKTVDCGEKLGNAITVETYDYVTDDQGSWQFHGWFDEDGNPWEDIYANEDVTLIAKWKKRIEGPVEVSFTIPQIGDTFSAPKAANNAPYIISDWYVIDDNWNDAEKADSAEPYELHFKLIPADESMEFGLINEDDELKYVGTVTVNGTEVDVYYDEDIGGLSGSYPFMPAEKEAVVPPEDEDQPGGKDQPADQNQEESQNVTPSKDTVQPAQKSETKKTDQTTTTQKSTSKKSTANGPGTGDERNAAIWWCIIAAACAGILLVTRKVKSKEG